MWFVSKKKYDEMEKLCRTWKASAEGANKMAEAWKKVALACQEDNTYLVAKEEEMLAKMKELEAKMKELEAKLIFVRKQRDFYYDLLENTSEIWEATDEPI